MTDEAPETVVDTDEDDLLAALLADEDEEFSEETEQTETRYAKGDEKLEKRVKALSEIVTRNERQKIGEKIYADFMATASESAKEIFAVLADDDMTAAQMRKVIDAANRKAATLDERLPPKDKSEDEGVIEERAAQLAAERWGTGPIRTDKSVPDTDREKELMDRIEKGDIQAYLEATFVPPPSPRR